MPPVTIPQGHFLTDSFEIGRPFRFALSFRHAVTEDVLFPDSTHFSPFLLRETVVLPTRTADGISVDSAVYTLVSFSTEPQLILRVPLYIVGSADCTTVYSSVDTVFFRSKLMSARPDTLQLRPSLKVVPLRQELNYPVLLVTLTVIGIVVGLIYALFGQALNRQWKLWQLHRNHLRFLRRYDKLVGAIKPETASDLANQAVVRWKRYLEKLEQQPYLTMTTPEIVSQIQAQETSELASPAAVENALKTTDRLIYGGTFTDESGQALQLLREVAIRTYQRRRVVRTQPRPSVPDPQLPESV
ncbi:hypothetical protein F5984_06595 [Rudanella paleaurantiibacter]|uniref:Uncharacterized protein n=1 Tax=Rudanella paleaurantiibacter TaxID=2614655 RepID=A0A7J5U287_9BACT|nr:hypothetical protein [Rudanella paleaurantiibacter]KAB7731887.1 hypothetical protein F5984_06595 [Rudanella paleaurantiibacter]